MEAAASSAALKLSFAAFCRMLDTVQQIPKKDAKLNMIFTKQLRQQLRTDNLYPLLRLLLPQLDCERIYNLKEQKIAKIYIELLGLKSTMSNDAKRLMHYKDPTVVQSKSIGDFAAVLYEVLLLRAPILSAKGARSHSDYTLKDIHRLLDDLNAIGDQSASKIVPKDRNQETNTVKEPSESTNAERRKIFMKILTLFCPNEQKWLIRIILKELKIGLGHERVLNFIHPDAMEMYNHTNDLHRICSELKSSKIRYVPIIEPFQVFSPMLAKRVEFGNCINAIGSGKFAMEPKLDGERVICHCLRGQVQLISRNGNNCTELYGPAIIPYIIANLKSDVDCILDGEMMVWDSLEQRFCNFGHLKFVAHAVRDGLKSQRWLCYVVWDLVYLSSENATLVQDLIRQVYHGPGKVHAVMGLPLYARRALLEDIFKPQDHRIVIIEQNVVTAESIKERHDIVMCEVDRRIASGSEGVVLKDLNAHYMCGESSRRAQRWIKLKPDYAGMANNLDVLILGGFYGSGSRRSGDVSVFLVGALCRSLEDVDIENIEAGIALPKVPIFSTFGKIGTGYSLDELAQVRRDLEPHWQSWDMENIPPHFGTWRPQKADVRPDVWIDPRHSIVLEVYGFELTSTALYETGLTLRFPRCHAIRQDKKWFECTTAQDIHIAHSATSKRKAEDVKLLSSKRQSKRADDATPHSGLSRKAALVQSHAQASLAGINVERDIFEGNEFCVFPGHYSILELKVSQQDLDYIISKVDMQRTTAEMISFRSCLSKQNVEQLIHTFGGTIVQNPMTLSTAFVVAASKSGLKFENLQKRREFDIINLRYVIASVLSKRILPLTAHDFLFMKDSTKAYLVESYDSSGDHYENHLTVAELHELMKRCENEVESPPAPWQELQVELLEEEYSIMEYEYSVLSHCVIYVDRFDNIPYKDMNYWQLSTSSITSDVDPHGFLQTVEQQLRLYGAIIAKVIDKSVTHIVVNDEASKLFHENRIEKLRPIIHSIRRANCSEPTVVRIDWAHACIRDGCQIPVQEYQIYI